MADTDIVVTLRECAAESRAVEGDYYADQFATSPEIFERAADEIERLRPTDAEREAVETAFDAMQYAADELGLSQTDCDRVVATLRGLLERLK